MKLSWAEGDDPKVLKAAADARRTFRYFWRELTWEYRRIVPAFHLSAVKLKFTDPGDAETVEYMWCSDVMFDGKVVSGTLLNAPNALRSVKAGDRAERPVAELWDWIIGAGDGALGAFSVNALRSTMGAKERAQHDAAWGLDFGDPAKVWAPKDEEAEHPMALNMAPDLEKRLASGEIEPNQTVGDGWTFLHSLALGGAAKCVEALLKHGADRTLKTPHGLTALELAQTLDWKKVIALLR